MFYSLLLPILITTFGVMILIKLRLFFILHPKRCLKKFIRALKSPEAKGALSLSLAGTLGVGNIVGIAYGISVCGEGIVLWLLVSSIFSMALKYAESALCASGRDGSFGGIMYVIRSGFGKYSVFFSSLYASLILILSLTMGSSLQLRSAIDCIDKQYSATVYIFFALFILIVYLSTLGGAKGIKSACKYIIPLGAVLYSLLTLSVIILNVEKLPSLLIKIVRSAFNFRSAGGGVSIFLFTRCLKEGFSRALLSNEAGSGTSGIAHSSCESTSPAEAGLFGISEVFFDTVLLCPLTGFAILLAPQDGAISGNGAEIVKGTLLHLGSFTTPLLFLCITLFAFSTVICWYYYGSVAAGCLSPRVLKLYPPLFFLSLFSSLIIDTSLMIQLSDGILFFLSLISLSAIIKNSDRLVYLSENEGLITKRGYAKEGFQERKASMQARPQK